MSSRSLRDVNSSPILKSAADRQLYADWNAKLEAEGLRALDNDYRGTTEFTSKHVITTGLSGNANLEFYDVLRDYCRYMAYMLDNMAAMPVEQREPYKRMLVLFVNGLSMPEAYTSIKAVWPQKLFTAIYFYKKFQQSKNEFKSIFNIFSQYLYYRKTELGTPLSFESWQSKNGLLKQ